MKLLAAISLLAGLVACMPADDRLGAQSHNDLVTRPGNEPQKQTGENSNSGGTDIFLGVPEAKRQGLTHVWTLPNSDVLVGTLNAQAEDATAHQIISYRLVLSKTGQRPGRGPVAEGEPLDLEKGPFSPAMAKGLVYVGSLAPKHLSATTRVKDLAEDLAGREFSQYKKETSTPAKFSQTFIERLKKLS